jgi:hypothetical protein
VNPSQDIDASITRGASPCRLPSQRESVQNEANFFEQNQRKFAAESVYPFRSLYSRGLLQPPAAS